MDDIINKEYELIEISSNNNETGSLTAFQYNNNCPFEIARCFYISNIKDGKSIRGKHANRNSRFLMTVISGSCKVLVDTGYKKEEFLLDSQNKALYLNKMIWKEMYDFSSDSRLVVFSDNKYDKNEYISNYSEFLKEVKNK